MPEQANTMDAKATKGDAPKTVDDLIGHQLRTYTSGDPITLDLRPDRVNIEISKDQKIVRVWFG